MFCGGCRKEYLRISLLFLVGFDGVRLLLLAIGRGRGVLVLVLAGVFWLGTREMPIVG